MFNLILLGLGLSQSIRTYSVIWRNSDEVISKQVNYPYNLRFKPMFEGEKAQLNKLKHGFVYEAALNKDLSSVDFVTVTTLKK